MLGFTRTNCYQLVRLMVATPVFQPEVDGFSTRLGFCPLPANLNNSKELHMELEFT
jgi:hypothetical protein